MPRFPRVATNPRFRVAACALLLTGALSAQTAVRSVRVLDSKDAVEIEIEASDRVKPDTQVLTNPERLVVDFPNAVPGPQLRNQTIHRGQVRGIRVGLFQAKPPVTRLVVDLNVAQSYQVFPSGRTVMIKIAPAGAAPSAISQKQSAGLVPANYSADAQPVAAPAAPPLQVTYQDGLLAIHADKASLSEVLKAVQQKTAAQVVLAPGAEQETVVVDFEPAPAPDVMARLLTGCKFNFLIISAPSDPHKLDRVILSPRTDGGPQPLVPMTDNPPPADQANDDDEQPVRPEAVPPPPDTVRPQTDANSNPQ